MSRHYHAHRSADHAIVRDVRELPRVRCARACAMCESYPAGMAPERHEQPPGHRAPARHDTPTGHAAAPRTPRASSTRAAPQRRRCPPDTARQLDASRPPETPLPPPTRPATEPARVPQSTAHPLVLIMFNNSMPARQGAYGAQAHSTAPKACAHAQVHSQRPPAVSHVLPARPRASSLPQWARAHCASLRLLSRGLRSRRPAHPPRSGAPAEGAGCFGGNAHCWRPLRAAPSRFAR